MSAGIFRGACKHRRQRCAVVSVSGGYFFSSTASGVRPPKVTYMKSTWKILTASVAALLISVAAYAADASPAGTWKWTLPGRGDRPGFEQKLQLDLKDGQLTGKLLGGQTPMGERPDVPITDASFKDGEVKFTISREFNGRSFTMKYDGKVEGDTIKGSVERPSRDGESRKSDWVATREKGDTK